MRPIPFWSEEKGGIDRSGRRDQKVAWRTSDHITYSWRRGLSELGSLGATTEDDCAQGQTE